MTINKSKIIKYAGASILTATLIAGAGLTIYDNNVDHTNEICPICNVLSYQINLSTGQKVTIGIIHQMQEMQQEYQDANQNVTMAYVTEYKESDETIIAYFKDEENKLTGKTKTIRLK